MLINVNLNVAFTSNTLPLARMLRVLVYVARAGSESTSKDQFIDFIPLNSTYLYDTFKRV